MSKFCTRCGKQIDDADNHCQYCGALQNDQYYSSDVSYAPASFTVKQPPSMLVKTIVILSAVFAVLLFIVRLTTSNSNYKDPVKYICRAMETGDGDYIEKAMPEFMIDLLDTAGQDCDELAENIHKKAEKEFGDDFDVSYDITDKVSIDSVKLKKSEDLYMRDKNMSISDGYRLKVEFTIKGDENKETQNQTIDVYKINGKWCILDFDM